MDLYKRAEFGLKRKPANERHPTLGTLGLANTKTRLFFSGLWLPTCLKTQVQGFLDRLDLTIHDFLERRVSGFNEKVALEQVSWNINKKLFGAAQAVKRQGKFYVSGIQISK